MADQFAVMAMDEEEDDFREVAHCGGKVTFGIDTDENGTRGYSVGYSVNSPKPMALFAVYALPQGLPCGDIQLGGIGDRWNPPPYPDCIAVFIGSDSHGRFGHQCPECGGYWRSSGAPSRWKMSCPYCGVRGGTWQFLTPAQHRYVAHYADTLMAALASDEKKFEVVIDMDAASDASQIAKPDFYYAGQTQQTDFCCETCSAQNDIKGQYGYCSICGTRNNAHRLGEELAALRARMNEDKVSPSDALKSAVSAYDSCCRNFVSELVEKVALTEARKSRLSTMLFHKLESVKEIESIFDIRLIKGIEADLDFMRMMFQRRHAFEHDGGQATERYVKESGDTTVTLGALIRENRENVHRLIGLLNRMATNFANGFHELFPPEEKPMAIKRECEERKKRRRGNASDI
jgi:hypothetical protein